MNGRSPALQNAPVHTHMPAPSMPGMSMPGVAGSGAMDTDYTALDRLLPTVIAQRLAPPILLAPPFRVAPTWTARSDAADRPFRVDLVLDGASGVVVACRTFSQHALLDRIIGYGVAIHEGQLFPPFNQAFGVLTALGMITLAGSAVVLRWRQRPAGLIGTSPAHAGARYPLLVGILVLTGLLLPLLEATMVMLLPLERLVLSRIAAVRQFLGLGSGR